MEEEKEATDDDGDNENDTLTMDVRQRPDYADIQKYRMEQQILLQLRSAVLSEALALRGVPIPSLKDASTPEGSKPPEKTDWECAISTEEDPKECIYTLASEVGTKVIAPVKASGEPDGWITVTNLNRLRRNDVSKVETMWHKKYAILDSWFNPDSEYSILQHVGPKGVFLNVLLDKRVLPLVVGFFMTFAMIVFMPVIEYFVNRLLVSAWLWNKWLSWARIVRLGLPFKLMVGQMALGVLGKAFKKLVGKVKDYLVQLECEILDETIPLTMGVPTPAPAGEESAEILVEEEEVLEKLAHEDEDEDDESSDDED